MKSICFILLVTILIIVASEAKTKHKKYTHRHAHINKSGHVKQQNDNAPVESRNKEDGTRFRKGRQLHKHYFLRNKRSTTSIETQIPSTSHNAATVGTTKSNEETKKATELEWIFLESINDEISPELVPMFYEAPEVGDRGFVEEKDDLETASTFWPFSNRRSAGGNGYGGVYRRRRPYGSGGGGGGVIRKRGWWPSGWAS